MTEVKRVTITIESPYLNYEIQEHILSKIEKTMEEAHKGTASRATIKSKLESDMYF